MSEGKDGDKKAKPKPVRTWPFPKEMDSDFVILEAKAEEINTKKRAVMEIMEEIAKASKLAHQLAESAWDQIREILAAENPEDEKLIFSCAGFRIVENEKLGIRTGIEAYMPDGAPEGFFDEDDLMKVNLRLRPEGSDDKSGPASGPSTTNTEEMFKEQFWRKSNSTDGEDEEKPEIPDVLPEDMHLGPDDE